MEGASLSGGTVLGPAELTDSVDGDDGVIDGDGRQGHSLYSNGSQYLTLIFSKDSLGVLPTYAGLVATDVGYTFDPNKFCLDDFVFKAYDQNGLLIGSGAQFAFGDGSAHGETAEDRYIGAYHAGGISKIEFGFAHSNDWEVDHVQYAAVPEPVSMISLGAGALALLRKRRKA